jgi:hypothetical protein
LIVVESGAVACVLVGSPRLCAELWPGPKPAGLQVPKAAALIASEALTIVTSANTRLIACTASVVRTGC